MSTDLAVMRTLENLNQTSKMPSQVIQIARTGLSLLEQKIITAAIYSVYTKIAKPIAGNNLILERIKSLNLTRPVRYYIDFKTLRDLTYFKSNNFRYFHKAIEKLDNRFVKYNLLGKDKDIAIKCPKCESHIFDTGERLVVCPNCGITFEISDNTEYSPILPNDLSSAFDAIVFVTDDIICFGFGNLMRYFYQKAQYYLYCKYSIEILNSLKSKSSYAIYLLVLDYVDEAKGFGQTPFMQIETFMALVGAEKYAENFKSIRIKVIEPAIREISEKTNLEVLFEDCDVKKLGRKVSQIRFRGSLLNRSRHKNSDPSLPHPTAVDAVMLPSDIKVEEFLNFLSSNARDKDAYKNILRASFRNGTFQNLDKKIDEFRSQKQNDNKQIERSVDKKLLRLEYFAKRVKREELGSLYLRDLNGNFYRMETFKHNIHFNEIIQKIANFDDERLSKILVTYGEKYSIEEKEKERYKELIVKPLEEISKFENWIIVIDNEPHFLNDYKYNFPVVLFRTVINLLAEKKPILFETNDKTYKASYDNSEFSLILISKDNQ